MTSAPTMEYRDTQQKTRLVARTKWIMNAVACIRERGHMSKIVTGPYRLSVPIGGFRDTYLGRQVVSRPGGPRAGMGSAGSLGALRAPLAGFGAEPQPKSNLLPFSPKISQQVATISIIFNAMQTTKFKVKNIWEGIWGGNASPASPLNPPMPATP